MAPDSLVDFQGAKEGHGRRGNQKNHGASVDTRATRHEKVPSQAELPVPEDLVPAREKKACGPQSAFYSSNCSAT